MSENSEYEEDVCFEGEDEDYDLEVVDVDPSPYKAACKDVLQSYFTSHGDLNGRVAVERIAAFFTDIDQPVAALGATIKDCDWEGTGTLDFERAWDWLETHGTLNAAAAARGEMYIMTNGLRDMVTDFFKGETAVESKGPTVLFMGDPSVKRSHWSFSLGRAPAPLEAMGDQGACVLSLDVVTESSSSAPLITAMATQVARLLSVPLSGLADATVRAECEPRSDCLRVLFIVDISRSTGTTRAVSELMDTLARSVSGFSIRTGWAASLANLFDEPLAALLASDVEVTLDTLPLPEGFWGDLARQLAPNPLFGWETLEDAYSAVPGLKALLGGDLQAKVDLTALVEDTLDSFLADMEVAEGSAATGGGFIEAMAPLLLMLCFEDDVDSPISTQMRVERVRALLELARLLVTRDVTALRAVELRARNGFGLRLEFEDALGMSSLFGAADRALKQLHQAADRAAESCNEE